MPKMLSMRLNLLKKDPSLFRLNPKIVDQGFEESAASRKIISKVVNDVCDAQIECFEEKSKSFQTKFKSVDHCS